MDLLLLAVFVPLPAEIRATFHTATAEDPSAFATESKPEDFVPGLDQLVAVDGPAQLRASSVTQLLGNLRSVQRTHGGVVTEQERRHGWSGSQAGTEVCVRGGCRQTILGVVSAFHRAPEEVRGPRSRRLSEDSSLGAVDAAAIAAAEGAPVGRSVDRTCGMRCDPPRGTRLTENPRSRATPQGSVLPRTPSHYRAVLGTPGPWPPMRRWSELRAPPSDGRRS